MKIPKLAKTGIINAHFNMATLGDKKIKGKKLPFYDKYYKIYKKTKNRRIKKKQEKKSWVLKFKNYLPTIDTSNIKLRVGNKIIYSKEEDKK